MAITKAKLSYIDGITSSTTELNILDGVTSNASELNYLDGIAGVVASTASTGSSIIPSGTTAQRDGSPAVGYLRFNTTEASFEGYDGSSWASVGGGINNQKLDDISSGFNSSDVNFTLAVSSSAVSPASVNNVLISLNGVIQEPTTTYTISGSTITFTTAPDAGDTFFGLYYGTLSVGVPGDGSVGTAQLSSANIAFDTSTLFIDSTNDRIGIGTITPSVELSIAGSDPQLVLWEGTDGASSSKVQLGTGTVQGFINLHKGDGTRTVQINSSGDTYFNGGNLGIGTSSPSSLLHLAVSSGAGSPTISLERTDTTVSTTNTIGNIVFLAGEDGTEDTVAQISAIAEENFTTTSSATGIFFSTTPSGSTSATERMRIDSSGNLLVGTTAATAYNNSTDVYGFNVYSNGQIASSVNGVQAAYFNRQNSDGIVLDIRKDGTTRGSIGTEGTWGSGPQFLGANSRGFIIANPNTTVNEIIPNVDTVGKLGNSSNRWADLYLSGGVYVGGTAAANYLDDYEEGTWTPTLVGSTSSSGQSYAVNDGDYTKIGNQVFCRFGLTMSVAGSFSGYIQLSGLPFNIENNPPTVHLGNLYFVNGGQNVLSVGLQGYEGTNRIYLWIKTTASGSREYPGSAFITNNLQLTGSFTYQTTS